MATSKKTLTKKKSKPTPAKKATKPAKKQAPKAKPAVDEAEAAAALLLEQYEAGDIDNAWDVIDEVAELDERLSKKSPLRKKFNAMYVELAELCRTDGDEE